jgi:hypothetical protein
LAVSQLSEAKKNVDLSKYAGIMKLSIDPLEYQRQIRDEWQ